MRPGVSPHRRVGLWRLLVAAVAAVVVMLLGVEAASASTLPEAETRVTVPTLTDQVSGVVCGSYGAPARSNAATTHATTTYDDPTACARGAEAQATTRQRARVDDESLSPFGRGGAAAKTEVPTVVFSRSGAPGFAGTFDDAVANGAPTQLNRVGTAARDANRRAAMRGQSPAPAGQSLDE